MCPIFPSQLPLPLVTLRLSTASLLDTVLVDNTNAQPLFSIETDNNQRRTTIYMYDHRQIAEVAAIQWPVLPYGATKTKQAPLITILGQTESSSQFLKKSMLGGSRKFHVPGQQNPLKWKHVAEHYECTLCSHACTAHRAVATFEPAHTTSAARLAIYTSSVTNTLPVSEYKGVDMDMMVYLIVSIIILQTQHNATHQIVTPVSPRMTSSHPSPISSVGNSHKIDLLAPDEAFVPSQQTTRNSPSSSSSCYSSLPASPISPVTDLSPITSETFASGSTSSPSSPNCPISRSSSTRGVRRQSTRHSSSPRSGPTSITPYHLPPIEHHSSPTQQQLQTPILRLQVPSPMASQAPSPRSNNALLLDTETSSSPTLYSSEQQHLQYHHHSSATSSIAVPAPPTEELPPAYSEIEWTVRVKQPRHVALAY